MLLKRGDIEIQQIIIFILAILVLITLIYIFRSNISQFLNTIGGISQNVNRSMPPIETVAGR